MSVPTALLDVNRPVSRIAKLRRAPRSTEPRRREKSHAPVLRLSDGQTSRHLEQ